MEHINEGKSESDSSSDSDLDSMTTNEEEGASDGAEIASDNIVDRANAEIDGSGDDADDSDWETICSDDSDDEIDEDIGLDDEEIKECEFFLKYKQTDDVNETIFTPSDLEEMKKRERVMMERNDRGYYRCKVKDKKLYESIKQSYSRFVTAEMLKQVNHPWSTQKNEALNTSVSSYAPKVKHYSATDSLLGRVSIAVGCQVVGYAAFWTKICSSLGFDIDPNLLSVLSARDEKKRKA